MFTQVALCDLNVAVIGQLPPPQLQLNRQLEPGSLEVEVLQATLRGWRLIKQSPENPPMDADGALVLP